MRRVKKFLAFFLLSIMVCNISTTRIYASEPVLLAEPEQVRESDDAPETEDLQKAAEAERSTPKEELGYVPGEVLVLYEADMVQEEEMFEKAEALDDTVTDVVDITETENLAVVEISEDCTVWQAIENYEGQEGVVLAEPNYLLKSYGEADNLTKAAILTSDARIKEQWYLDAVNLEGAWQQMSSNEGSKVKVAVLDTGAYLDHADLTNIINKEDSAEVVNNGEVAPLFGDPDGHGTHVSGIIAAECNNSKGIAGVASTTQNNIVDLMVVDVFKEETTTAEYVVKGISYSVEKGAKVINMSLGGTGIASHVLEMACQEAYEKGVTLVCAAGNDNTDTVSIPSDYDSTIGVINVTSELKRAKDSNYGVRKDLSAPGTDILSTYPFYNNDETPSSVYATISGTSMAAPVVTAIAAMMLRVNPNLSPDSIKEILCSTAKDIDEVGKDANTGYGIVDANAAVAKAGDRNVDVIYQTHVQTHGWQNEVMNGETSGTIGKAKRLEGIKINVSGAMNLGVQYRTHVQTYGWQDWKSDGALSGTTGESKRLEAIQIELTGSDAAYYDIYYRVHSQTYGWLGWASNGASAGTAGYGKRLEAIEIRVVKKGEQTPPSDTAAFHHPLVRYKTHVQTYGWQGWALDGALSGTTGQSKRLEEIKIELTNHDYAGAIQYKTHVQTYGWQDWKSDGALSGTTGASKRLEAIQIKLTGDMAKQYDIYYRVHAQTYGWLGWASNGASAGTAGYSKRLEGIQIQLVPKGGNAPGSTTNTFVSK